MLIRTARTNDILKCGSPQSWQTFHILWKLNVLKIQVIEKLSHKGGLNTNISERYFILTWLQENFGIYLFSFLVFPAFVLQSY